MISTAQWTLGACLAALLLPAARLEAEAGLVVSTFLGGSDRDEAAAVAVAPDGGIHVTGATASADFPVVAGRGNPDPEDEYEPWDAFLTRLAPDGGGLTRSTFLPDDFHDEFASDLAVGPGGEEHVVGWWTDIADDWEIWISTSNRIFTPYYGESLDHLEAVVLTPDGHLLVAGSTCSRYFFGIDRGARSPCVGFVETWATGGTFLRRFLLEGLFPEDVAVDPAGHIYVAASESFHLPSYDGSGRYDVRVVKLDPSGHPLYSVRLGGSSGERPSGIAVDAAGSAYVTGQTESADFPVVGGVQGSLSGERDAFVAKIDPSGAVAYSTYLGGTGRDAGRAIAVDALGNAILAGTTGSWDFPVASPVQDAFGGGASDAFVARLALRRGPDLLLLPRRLRRGRGARPRPEAQGGSRGRGLDRIGRFPGPRCDPAFRRAGGCLRYGDLDQPAPRLLGRHRHPLHPLAPGRPDGADLDRRRHRPGR